MGESDVNVVNSKNNNKCSKVVESSVEENVENVNPLQCIVRSFQDSGKAHDSVEKTSSQNCSALTDLSCLEILVDGLVQKAREDLIQCTKLNPSFFLCALCRDVVTDPVTLKCGHTFSKKCVLVAAKNGSFECKKCTTSYSYSYLSALKINVKILAVIENFWKSKSIKCSWESNIKTTSKGDTGDTFVTNKLGISSFEKMDFECPLCMRILWEPVTTTCGHTFCRLCLYRCFDHQTTCPLCKTSLANFFAERIQSTTELLAITMQTLIPTEFAERETMHLEEMYELYKSSKGTEHTIPLFICTTAYPTVPCPLHIFEPRYRLMIRRCMESGSRRFGMCCIINNEIAEHGTILEIQDVQYFPDGRSVVDTIGSERFNILETGLLDGYHTATVKYTTDVPPSDLITQDTKEFHDMVFKASQSWYTQLTRNIKFEILRHFGPMPEVEENYPTLPHGPAWVWWMAAVVPSDQETQVMFISTTSLLYRLQILYRLISHFK